MDQNCKSTIAEWFNDRSILVTGATGFLGKVLVEKLLRSCPGIKNIYLLMRNKRGSNCDERLDTFKNTLIFNELKNIQLSVLDKLIAVDGDIGEENLGINISTINMLKDVSVVFHLAATLKFDEVLKLSLNLNLLGTKRLIELCEKLPRIEVFVHCSTAYTNFKLREVAEKVYPTDEDPYKVLENIKFLDEDEAISMTPKLLNGNPNTYVYTKALAENLINNSNNKFPIAIARPSMVTAALREPIPGWIDNYNGPTYYYLGIGKGLLRTAMGCNNKISDLIPVDLVTNALIAIAWSTALERNQKPIVYNCVSGSDNPITWESVANGGFQFTRKYPFGDVMRYPHFELTSSRIMYNIHWSLFHTFPAHLIDFVQKINNKSKPRSFVRLYEKYHDALTNFEPFVMNDWNFSTENMKKLYGKMSDTDKIIFNFNVKQIEWKSYLENYVQGISLYLLKYPNLSTKQNKKRMKRLQIVYYAFMFAKWSICFGLIHFMKKLIF